MHLIMMLCAAPFKDKNRMVKESFSCVPRLRLSALFPAILVIGSVYVGAPSGADAQNYAQVFASVVNSDGVPVLDLTADDFDFKIGEETVELAGVRLDPTTPKIALLLDNGDGMYRLSADSALKTGVKTFLETLDRGTEVGVFTLAPQVRRRKDFTAYREEVIESASGYFSELEAGTRMMDGFLETWDRRFEAEDPWPVFVLVMGPGEDLSSYVTENEYGEFVQDLIIRGATVHAIGLTAGAEGVTPGHPHSLAENLTQNTGGSFQSVTTITGLDEALAQLAEHMNYHSYLVSLRYQIVHLVPNNSSGDVSVNPSNPSHSLQLFLDRRLPE